MKIVKVAESQKRTPISYYGGKQLMARYILPNIPKHTVYVEAFAGGAAIFFAKEKSAVEFLNDTNGEIVNFYRVLRDKFPQLQKLVRSTLHSRDQHRRAFVIYKNSDMFTDVQRAWALWMLSSQGYAGQLGSSWGRELKSDKTAKAIRNKRDNFTELFEERLRDVSLECQDAVRLIKTTDAEDVFFYLDPPYYNANMGHYDGYTIEDFEMLLKAISEAKGKFLLSSYPSEILTKYTKEHGWFQIEIEQAVHASNKGRRKIEVLTANYDISNPFVKAV